MTHTLIDIETLKVLVEYGEFHLDQSYFNINGLAGALATAEELIANPYVPKVVANITGGVLQGASSDYPLEVYVLDFDVSDPNATIEVEGSDCHASCEMAVIDPVFVSEVVAAFDEPEEDAA